MTIKEWAPIAKPPGVRIYTTYFNASDFPGKYVVRGRTIHSSTFTVDEDCVVFDSLTEARAHCRTVLRLTCVGRDPEDDPVIVESWV